MTILRLALLLLATTSFSAAAAAPDPPPTASLASHVVVGYQGWFGCRGEAGVADGMMHWLWRGKPRVEMLPDLTEIPAADRCPMALPDGSTAMVYSAANPVVVDTHFTWMQRYGLDTAAVQRFVGNVKAEPKRRFFDAVLAQVKDAAERHGRTFFVEYDLSGGSDADVDALAADWARLVAGGLTASPAYQRQGGRPLVGVYGLGFAGRPWTPAGATMLLAALRGTAGGAAIMLGVPAWWRTGTRDAAADPAWQAIYAGADVISPWTVGRFADDAGADAFRRDVMAPDLAWAKARGLVYLPVAFPGFSWSNLHDGTKPMNKIPRRCGAFLEHQLANIVALGADAAFVAMFDEVNEGTAIFKVRPHRGTGPGGFLDLDADGCDLPSDFYMRLVGAAGARLRR